MKAVYRSQVSQLGQSLARVAAYHGYLIICRTENDKENIKEINQGIRHSS